jgi:hypothetical protein
MSHDVVWVWHCRGGGYRPRELIFGFADTSGLEQDRTQAMEGVGVLRVNRQSPAGKTFSLAVFRPEFEPKVRQKDQALHVSGIHPEHVEHMVSGVPNIAQLVAGHGQISSGHVPRRFMPQRPPPEPDGLGAIARSGKLGRSIGQLGCFDLVFFWLVGMADTNRIPIQANDHGRGQKPVFHSEFHAQRVDIDVWWKGFAFDFVEIL